MKYITFPVVVMVLQVLILSGLGVFLGTYSHEYFFYWCGLGALLTFFSLIGELKMLSEI
jgi:hypothetical protein|tara:strand:- start:173 stop:349 length:177 start_codon:yes stop_codon:yes gene_type:complete